MYDDMQPDNNPMAHSAADEAAHDREGAMAKADLYKLANYSLKLFKKLQDDDQLEGWVQAKITKAADYVASVYHYLEYEMKISEYGEQLNNAEMMSEGRKETIKNKLLEAKAKVAELKKLQAEKLKKEKKEKKVSEAKSCNHTNEGTDCPVHGMKECGGMEEGFDDKAKVGDTFKTQRGTATKTSTGVKHTRDSKPEDDEDYVPPKKEKKTAMTGAERREQKAKDKEQEKSSKAYEKKYPGSVKRYQDGKLVNEADKGDMDNDSKDEPDDEEYKQNKDVAIKKAMGKKEKKVDEAKKKPDANKDGIPDYAQDGKGAKDLGKKGNAPKKGVNPFAKKDKKVDETAEWKTKAVSLRESLESMITKKEVSQENAIEEMMAMAAEFDAEGLAEASKDPAKLDEFLQNMFAVEEVAVEEVVDAVEVKQEETINESTDFDRMKQFLTRLNG